MFYQDDLDQALRFGDIVRGYILTNAILGAPSWEMQLDEYTVQISSPQFSVIMTPCCSIEDKTIILTPLIQVYPKFFDNPYLVDDLTGANRIMSPQQALSPEVWKKLGDEERQRREAEGNTYAFVNLFVYERHNLLPEYPLHRKQGEDIITGYYMVNFKNLYKVHCDKIITPQNSPLESKHLQLSVDIREELRVKLARYYSRVPQEDQLVEV
ncbi:hypothetical protein ES703_103541 [subsurface metagenome]